MYSSLPKVSKVRENLENDSVRLSTGSADELDVSLNKANVLQWMLLALFLGVISLIASSSPTFLPNIPIRILTALIALSVIIAVLSRCTLLLISPNKILTVNQKGFSVMPMLTGIKDVRWSRVDAIIFQRAKNTGIANAAPSTLKICFSIYSSREVSQNPLQKLFCYILQPKFITSDYVVLGGAMISGSLEEFVREISRIYESKITQYGIQVLTS